MQMHRVWLWTALAVLLPLRSASGAGGFAAADLEQAQSIIGQMQGLSKTISSRPVPAVSEVPQVPAGRISLRPVPAVSEVPQVPAGRISLRPVPPSPADVSQLRLCGPWGAFCAQPLAMAHKMRAYSNDTGPIGTGFKALGPAGKTGVIDGPGGQGNGTYRVVANDDYRLQVVLDTGYLDGEITLTRDPATGQTAMRFVGRRWDKDQDAWGPAEDATKEMVVEYDAKKDFGYLRWVEDGEWKSERYWGGAEGTDMTIEFGGGWDHDFSQDQ